MRSSSRRLVFALTLLGALAAPAWAQSPKTESIRTQSTRNGAETARSLEYYLPAHVLKLDISEKTETLRRARTRSGDDKACDAGAPPYPIAEPATVPEQPQQPAAGAATPVPIARLCIEEVRTTTRVVSAELQVMPDFASGARSLTLPGRALADVKLSVQLRDGALLSGLNASSQGRAGQVILGIAKFAATLIGATRTPVFIDASGRPAPSAARDTCNPFLAPLKDQADHLRLLLSRNATACSTWKSMATWTAHVAKLADEVKTNEEKLGGTNEPELEVLVKKLREQRRAVEDGRKAVAALKATLTAMLDAFVQAHNLGTKVEDTRRVDTLGLHELPGAQVDIEHGETERDVLQKALDSADKYKRAAGVLRRSGVTVRLLRLDVLSEKEREKAGSDRAAVESSSNSATCADARDERLQVWFRTALPARLEVFAAGAPAPEPGRQDAGGTPKETMRLMSERVEPVMLQSTPAQCVAFKTSAFANRDLIVSFDDRGQLARVEHNASSSAAAAATALASAATTFRDEYAATLAKVTEIQSNERKIKLDDLTTRIETLKKERERLDAQLATDAAAANFDLALQQQKLAAEAAELQAEAALEVARSTADQRIAIEQLKTEIELVKRELELLKAKQDLAAGKGSDR